MSPSSQAQSTNAGTTVLVVMMLMASLSVRAEVFDELEVRQSGHFVILPRVALALRFDYFLYVPADRPGLHRILLQGLNRAYNNGSFMELFENHPIIKETMERADFGSREVIHLKTPDDMIILDEIPDRFWHPAILETGH